MLKEKQAVAKAALAFIKPNEILGLGTGSTVDCLIELLPSIKKHIKGIVSSSERTSQQIEALGIPLIDLNTIDSFSTYIDGADEINANREMIKGGGGALTREKIVAAHAKQFICIADSTKKVAQLGAFPLPIEVIPMAAHYVIRQMEKLGGKASVRPDFITDNGNLIVDVRELVITNPKVMETTINQMTGVVTNGLFAHAPASILLISDSSGHVTQY